MAVRQATAHINLDAVAHNFDYVKELAPSSRVMAVVKANAYGHGAVQVARKLNAEAYAVSRVSEAVELREAGVTGDICLLEGVMDKEELNLASVYELQVVVHSPYQLSLMKKAGARRPMWIKVDTGMGRLGFSLEQVKGVVSELRKQKVAGYMTHLAEASDPASEVTAEQIAKFQSIPAVQGQVLSIANSAGLVAHPDSRADWVRPGIMLYGATPFDDQEPMVALQPAMTFSAPVIAVHAVRAGDSVGYGGLWTATADTRVAVLAVGYADGYPREIKAGTPVILNGERRTIVGRVSMDMICVELTPSDKTEIGDRAVLWGEGLPVEEIARASDTITYTLLAGVSPRVNRQYRGEVNRG